jgi:hypothetical protein
MTGKSRNQPGLQKGLYIQDALKPSGITYVKTVLIVKFKNLKFLNLHNTSKAVLKYTLYIFLIVSPTSLMRIRLFHILKERVLKAKLLIATHPLFKCFKWVKNFSRLT